MLGNCTHRWAVSGIALKMSGGEKGFIRKVMKCNKVI